jgi:two-component system, sensor histidine kinase PdtaS
MLDKLSALRAWPLWLRVGVCAGALAAAYAFQIPLEREVPGEPFLLFFILVVASALAFGEPIGFLACGLSTVLSFYFFDPGDTLAIHHAADLIKIELYAVLSGLSVAGVAWLTRAIVAERRAFRSMADREKKASVLLQDMAHRVANNFAVVAALIQSRASVVAEPKAKLVLADAVEQVAMMARLHRHLLHDNGAVALDAENFLHELTSDLQNSMGKGRPVLIATSCVLSIEQSVPLGLIVNELVTNALKHAFPSNRSGIIRVILEKEAPGRLALTVEDDGVGFRGQHQKNGTGQRLVALLAKELGGSLESRSLGQGTSFRVAFPFSDLRLPVPQLQVAHSVH